MRADKSKNGGKTMPNDDLERTDSLEDLSLLLIVIQRMGRTLANTSHASSYRSAREFNELLHQARLKLDAIRAAAPSRADAGKEKREPLRHKPRVM